MVYLNDVPTSADGCMMAMLHNASGAPFRVQPVDKVWGRYLSPPAVPKPWLAELLARGFRPHCIRGAAGTTIFFHPNIVHRASAPQPGRHRDVLLVEVAPTKPPLQPSVTASYAWGERRSSTPTQQAPAADSVHVNGRHLHSASTLSVTLGSAPTGGPRFQIPMLGFGTARYDWRLAQPKALSATVTAYLRLGGRLIDTAVMYANDGAIRMALNASGVARSEVFLMTKVNTNTAKVFKNEADQARYGWVNSSEGARRAIRESLHTLGTGYLDAVLIHGPFGLSQSEVQAVWSGLLASQREGEVRTVGVSNMDQAMIRALEAASGVRPAINQLEWHPWSPQATHDLVNWCLQHGIVVVAYGSLGGKRDAKHSAAAEALAAKHHVSTAQVLLRWAVDQNVVVIPGATREAHIADNLRLTGFTLSAADRAMLQGEGRPAGFRLTSNLKMDKEERDAIIVSLPPPPRPPPGSLAAPLAAGNASRGLRWCAALKGLRPRGTCPPLHDHPYAGGNAYSVVDVVQFNDELATLRYRLKLHSAFANTFVVAEANVTYAGFWKPLYATDGLTDSERRAYNIRIFVVPVPENLATPSEPNIKRENFQRSSINRFLAANFKQHLIFFSDVDEFLDPEAVRSVLLNSALLTDSSIGCLTPRMRLYYYSEHCPVNEPWAAATLTRSDSYFFTKVVASGLLLRWWGQGAHNAMTAKKIKKTGRAICPEPDGLHGWHLSCAQASSRARLSVPISFLVQFVSLTCCTLMSIPQPPYTCPILLPTSVLNSCPSRAPPHRLQYSYSSTPPLCRCDEHGRHNE